VQIDIDAPTLRWLQAQARQQGTTVEEFVVHFLEWSAGSLAIAASA
jgi:hypothetical protein